MPNGVVRYYCFFKHLSNKHALTHRVEVAVKQEDVWSLEIHKAKMKAYEVIANACDDMYLAGDHMDYELTSVRRRGG